MSGHCQHNQFSTRKGACQHQRLLQTLDPDHRAFIRLDERTMSDDLIFTKKLADTFHFVAPDGNNTETWASFFNYVKLTKSQSHEPHLALFIAFLKLLTQARKDLNQLTSRHLNFFYQVVLGMRQQAGKGDQTILLLKLAPGVNEILLKKGTSFSAGKDDSKRELIYKALNDVIINRAQVKSLKALFIDFDNDHRIYASPVADSADGRGTPVNNPSAGWKPFGDANRDQAEVGFAITTPLLFMEEGSRLILLRLAFSHALDARTLRWMKSGGLRFQVSAAKTWIDAEITQTSDQIPGRRALRNNQVEFFLRINETQPPITTPAANAFPEARAPVVKCTLNTELDSFAYRFLKSCILENISVTVAVTGKKNLIIQNDNGLLDPSKPFQPFGHRPVAGSNWYIGSGEVFQRRPISMHVDIKWRSLPRKFTDHYRYYQENSRTNATFKISAQLLEGRQWKTLNGNQQLFTDAHGVSIPPGANLPNKDQVCRINLDLTSSTTAASTDQIIFPQDLTEYTSQTQRGFVRLQLAGTDFGHAEYPPSLIRAIAQSPSNPLLPAEPYTPVVHELSVGYTSKTEIQLDQPSAANRTEKFFHIEPFGIKENLPGIGLPMFLFPQFPEQGSLFIGLEDFDPLTSATVSLAFQMEEGSANPDFISRGIKWHYLSNNRWLALEPTNVLADSTNGLLTSGLVTLSMPKTITSANSILPPRMHWIKVTISGNYQAIPNIMSVKAQGVIVELADPSGHQLHLGTSLAAKRITKLVNSDARVKTIDQPFSSFRGKSEETLKEFYTRTSERIRHKNRAVTAWDYERLILQNFGDVHLAKTLNHTRYPGGPESYSEKAPGHVTVIVVPHTFNRNSMDLFHPRAALNTLLEITKLLQQRSSRCVALHVRNPIYEEVQMDCHVRFKAGLDASFYRNLLDKEIQKYVSPWAFSHREEINFGSIVHRSQVLNKIEKLEYVDYVTCFKMRLLPSTDDVDEAVPRTSASILTSASSHKIEIIESDTCDCETNFAEHERTIAPCNC